MKIDLPMKSTFSYTEQINVKVTSETKDAWQILKGRGVNVGEFCRSVLTRALSEAVEKIESQKSNAS